MTDTAALAREAYRLWQYGYDSAEIAECLDLTRPISYREYRVRWFSGNDLDPPQRIADEQHALDLIHAHRVMEKQR